MQARGTWSAGEDDDNERFLADLCAMREEAAVGYEELAARAHYPSDILKEAENGPSLPGLPILAAFVRACDGDVPEWEERWRRLGIEVRADPGLPVRAAGASPAAVAGARAGVGVAPPDAYDPERIRAALRGSAMRTDTAAAQATAGQHTGEAARWDTGVRADTAAGWDATADQASTAANGNHSARQEGDTSTGATVDDTPDPAVAADALRRDPFSSSWLHDSQPIASVPDTEPAGPDRAGSDRTSPDDDGHAPPGWRDFWTPVNAAAAPADVQRPGAAPADEPPTAETSWSAFTASPPEVTADPDHRQEHDLPQPAVPTRPAGTRPAAAARSQAPTEPAVPQPTPAVAGKSRPDRYYPLRLLAVIVVAALIGSILVLVLR